MKLKSFHWTRRTVVYALIGLAVLLALAVIWRSNGGVLSAHYNVTTTDGRIAYLQALGWEADPATETAQEIVIPRVFSGVFSDYNALQKQQGFDLSTYAGETCTAYTYRVTNYEGSTDTVLAQLFVYRNRVIGGDIHATAMDGFMQGREGKKAQNTPPAGVGGGEFWFRSGSGRCLGAQASAVQRSMPVSSVKVWPTEASVTAA